MAIRGNAGKVSAVAVTVVAVIAVVAVLVGPGAFATHAGNHDGTDPTNSGGTPANKYAASGSTTEVFGPGIDVVILQEQVKMSTNHELLLSLSLECSIVTALKLGDDSVNDATDEDSATGQIDVWIELDGNRVGVTSSDAGQGGRGRGEVTFCNTVHQQRVTDSEDNDPRPDGIDTHETYLKTKTATAFNWLALNVGSAYDLPYNGNNILDVVVKARLVDTTPGTSVCVLGSESCSEAVIGNRTLIAEPTLAAVTEVVEPAGPGDS